MKRRTVLQSALAAGAAAAALPGCAQEGRKAAFAGLDEELLMAVRSAPPMNLPRAYQVLEQERLDGLVLADPVNVYHMTGYWPQLAAMGYPAPAFALLAAGGGLAPGLVMSQFLYYYVFADAGFQYPLQTYLFTGWDTALSASDLPGKEPAATPYVFADLGQTPIGAREKRRLAALDQAAGKRQLSANVQQALLKALKDMGLHKGAVGIDHPAAAMAFEAANLPATLRYAENILRKIRVVKSPNEVKLMRRAAALNAEAALAAAKTAREGATYQELRAEFFAQAAKLGNSPAFMSIDRMASEVGNAAIREGQGFFIDCVSHLLHYHGDYGRTIFVGEPAEPMKRAAKAMSLGWDAVRERLKPGLRYSEIRTIGKEAVRKAGYKFDIAFNPHSVGLMHTDEPGRDGTPFLVKDDLVLEENMILSVDCPVRNTGIGGSAHLEDLTLITKDGAKQINDIGDRVIVV